MKASLPQAPGPVNAAEAHELAGLVDYAPGAVVSRTLSKGSAGTLTVFAFDREQALSEHSAPFDAWVLALDGVLVLTIGGKRVEARPGQIVLMPANIPHAVAGEGQYKMLLIMQRHAQPAAG
jgi:quercetin dioxygenase-like cupin family protein